VGALLRPELSWNLQGGTVHPKPVPTVIFTWSWSMANPPYYSIAITPMGSVTYKSFPTSDQKTGSPYVIEFEASRGLRTRIFAIVQQLNFFRGKYRITQNPNPVSVSKSLTYDTGFNQSRVSYATSKSRPIRELTGLFERMSLTINTRRLLESMRLHNPNGLEPELKGIAVQNRRKRLIEPQILIPALQQIVSDANISQAARREGNSMLHRIEAP
jgi:hypothetical protein